MDIDVPLRELGAIDISALRDAILNQEDAAWYEDKSRQKSFYVHDQTRSIVLLNLDDSKWPNRTVHRAPGWERLADVAVPIMREIIEKRYPVGGEVVRAMAASLCAGENIKAHADVHQAFHCGHRIHVPITTNPKVWFTIDGRPYQFEVGQGYEVNNQKQHSVVNKGNEDRITFIFDYVPPGPLAYVPDERERTPVSRKVADSNFKKLLGKAKNYLLIHSGFDVAPIRKRIEQIPDARWLESQRQQRFDIHSDTRSLDLIHFFRDANLKPDYRELYFELQEELEPLVNRIADYYQNNGFLVRMLLTQMAPGSEIPEHVDSGPALMNCHRVHIPITTNDKVIFMVDGEKKNMQVGEFWEIDNSQDHSVENQGNEDRIHLIVDWMPNLSGQSEEDVLAALH